ncbi:MAG: hypothetical protein MRERV_56c014 [Mycoplasmataceae bacterium RV_VA103A]|nr:MAG: hypothetical protein MRERV_56c014 [Mycoplasmataceae bacterium RV_VA103A]
MRFIKKSKKNEIRIITPKTKITIFSHSNVCEIFCLC